MARTKQTKRKDTATVRTGPFTKKEELAWKESIKDKKTYMHLREKGKSKKVAAQISNSKYFKRGSKN